MTDIERLRELLAKTRLPWRAGPFPFDNGPGGDAEWCVMAPDYAVTGPDVSDEDASLIAEAINALPALLADYERLRGMEERVKGAAVGEMVRFDCTRCPVSVDAHWQPPDCPECGDPCVPEAPPPDAAIGRIVGRDDTMRSPWLEIEIDRFRGELQVGQTVALVPVPGGE